MDIGGAIAFFTQTVTFIENLVVACTDTLALPVMCAESVTGIVASAGLLTHFGASLQSTCAHLDLVTDTATFQGDFVSIIGSRTDLFLRECSLKLAQVSVHCIMVVPGSIVVTLAGSRDNLDNALDELSTNGLNLPSFDPLVEHAVASPVVQSTSALAVAKAQAEAAGKSAISAQNAATEANDKAAKALKDSQDSAAAVEAAEQAHKQAQADAAAAKAAKLQAEADAAQKQAQDAAAAADAAAKAAGGRRLHGNLTELLTSAFWESRHRKFEGESATLPHSTAEHLLRLMEPALSGQDTDAPAGTTGLWSFQHECK